jgi:hypothetical protein
LGESIKHTFSDSFTWNDSKFKNDIEPKEDANECVEHDHNLMIVKDCPTSWSSDGDDDTAASSLDKIDDDASSDTNDDATLCILDSDDDGSCLDHIATTSLSTTPHYFMLQDDTKGSNTNVVDHINSYDDLVASI